MKSVIAQGSTVAKAIEEALKKAEMPQEFFIKVLEDAQAGFLGFGSKKAKIALFFQDTKQQFKQQTMFEQGAYHNLFNNPAMSKQIEQQLKDLGLEIKPIAPKPQHANNPKIGHQQGQSNNQPKPQKPSASSAQSHEDGQAKQPQRQQSNEFQKKPRPRYFKPRVKHTNFEQRVLNTTNSQTNKPKPDDQ